MLISQYYSVILFVMAAAGFSALILFVSYLRSSRRPNNNKNSSYECGFKPISPTIKTVNIRFYLLAIMFIIFDVEIVFLYPWAVTLNHIGFLGFFSMVLFLTILMLAFIYEWRKGALEWD